jgi:hypothetical protein
MNYFLLTETEFFRRINEAGDCNMETAYTAFATQVIELCNGNVDTNRTIIALAYMTKINKSCFFGKLLNNACSNARFYNMTWCHVA